MKTENKILMQQARASLAGKWKLAVGTAFLYMFIMILIGSPKNIGQIFSLIATGPFSVGIAIFSLSISRNKEAKTKQIFEGFNKFTRALVAHLLVVLFTILWSLLFIVPGIIAALAYSQTFFILADDPNISASDAIKKSKKMMNGYKWKYFCLGFRFIGWLILSALTFGIGLLWLLPYIQITYAKFFDDVNTQEQVVV